MTSTEIKLIRAEVRSTVKDLLSEMLLDVKREMKGHHQHLIEVLRGYGLLDAEEELWTKKDVMVKFGVSRAKIDRMMQEGTLPFVKLGSSRQATVKFRPVDTRIAFAEDRN